MSILRFVPTLALSKSGKVEGTTPSSQPAVASSLEFVVVSAILCSSQFGRGLLASSHAGTRLPIALVRPRRSPSSAALLRETRSLPFQTKTGGNRSDASCKKSLNMTSYGGIIRIRLKGRSLMTSSQPATRAPLFCNEIIIHLLIRKYKQFSSLRWNKKEQNRNPMERKRIKPKVYGIKSEFLWNIFAGNSSIFQ